MNLSRQQNGSNINKGKLIGERVRIGQLLRANRESKGLSLPELSERTGYSERALQGAETGQYSPSLDQLTAISIYLDFSVELMNW